MKYIKSQTVKYSLIYWISTLLVVMNWGFGAVSSLLKAEPSMTVFNHLGYPGYFSTMLATAQLLGVLALLLPVPRTLREWAYAGLTFDVLSACFSLLAVGSPVSQLSFPVIALTFLITSYVTWRGRIAGQTLSYDAKPTS